MNCLSIRVLQIIDSFGADIGKQTGSLDGEGHGGGAGSRDGQHVCISKTVVANQNISSLNFLIYFETVQF